MVTLWDIGNHATQTVTSGKGPGPGAEETRAAEGCFEKASRVPIHCNRGVVLTVQEPPYTIKFV
jgi:hypothetical protein